MSEANVVDSIFYLSQEIESPPRFNLKLAPVGLGLAVNGGVTAATFWS
jgi:hypothetical protein